MAENPSIEKISPKGVFIFMGVVAVLVILILAIIGSKNDNGNPTNHSAKVSAETTSAQAPKQTPAPIDLNGHGDQATEKFTLNKGLAKFKLNYTGSDNFIVELFDSDGNSVGGSMVNAIGAYDGSHALQIPEDGQYVLNITAGGDWTVTITQD